MQAHQGDRIEVESNKVGSPPRTGEVIEVLERTDTQAYLVRWDDGHESVFYPSAGVGAVTQHAS